MIGGKPGRISWHDFGRIVAAAYAIGGRDAAFLDRIEERAEFESEYGGTITRDDLFWIVDAIDDLGLYSKIKAHADARHDRFEAEAEIPCRADHAG